MAIYSFDGADLKMMLQGAVELLGQSKKEIDSLNVFPVPDGDTGTNMYRTMLSAVSEVQALASNHIGAVAEAAAHGGLIGASGNSGVLLSQILHGFACSLNGLERATASDIATALAEGAKVAYQTVMNPVEGTILTVVRKSAEGAADRRSADLLRLMITILNNAFIALEETPELLPALKQAGVVDAGGKGFVVILEGFLHALKSASSLSSAGPKTTASLKPPARSGQLAAQNSSPVINFTYCTELLVKGPNLPLEKIKDELCPYGNSLMVVGGDCLAKVHIHSNHPGLVLECCLKHGSLHDLKINNMVEQNRELFSSGSSSISDSTRQDPSKPFGIISVGVGDGIAAIMKNLGADTVVSGGQTLNPSTGGFLEAIEEMDVGKIIILPNNKNIILTAKQAGKLSSKEVSVIPSKSIPQGLAALLTLNPEDNFETTGRKMAQAILSVRSGEITSAVRDNVYQGLNIKKGDIIGLADGDLKCAGTDQIKVLEELLETMLEGEGRLVTLYFGEAVTNNQAEAMSKKMCSKYKVHNFDVQRGGQPVYDLIISVE
ncbi:MAG: DAK2 domain-containing protein [Desulfotomaculaceae bacterium]|nr:DAK2 domain-containing protein [Desulfotomaculaceae bacterium]